MKKQIKLDGKDVTIASNALLPRQYRAVFGRDLIVDMRKLAEGYQKDPDAVNMEVLENVTWLMLKAGGEAVPDTVEAWLGSIDDSLAVYMAMNDVLGLWLTTQQTTSRPKKK